MLFRPALKVVRNSVVQCPQILSRAFICLTVSLVSSSIPASGFAARHKTLTQHNFQWHRAMATTDLSTDDVGNSPTKILLHDKDADVYERDLIGTITPPSANGLKIISWNVAGLRGTMKKDPEVLNELVDKENPDILCLQETKLQIIGDFDTLLVDRGYKSYWSMSEVKKGYSGTAVFVKEVRDPKREAMELLKKAETPEPVVVTKKPKKQAKMSAFLETKVAVPVAEDGITDTPKVELKDLPPGTVNIEDVVYQLPDKKFNGEGRWVQIETPDFYLINTYVPNSGQNLERLDYRTDEWDPHVRDYLNKLREKKPVIYCGDLNVAHTDLDVYNFHAKHLLKQAGTTLREKESFSKLLNSGFHDSLRYIYPAAKGQFTYWSMRTRARPYNKGLRLDYFVCSQEMFDTPDVSIIPGSVDVSESSKVDAVEQKAAAGDADVEVVQSTASSSSSKKAKGSRKRPAAEVEKAVEVEVAVVKAETSTSHIVYPNPRDVKVVDSYVLADANDCSDHCPVVLVLQTRIPSE